MKYQKFACWWTNSISMGHILTFVYSALFDSQFFLSSIPPSSTSNLDAEKAQGKDFRFMHTVTRTVQPECPKTII